MVATASARSVAVSCWALTSASGTARLRPRTATERMITRLIYLLLFVSPQVLLYLYLRERLPDPTRPERARPRRSLCPPHFAPALPRPRHVRLCRCRCCAVGVRHLERVPAAPAHPPHLDVP